MDEVNVIRIRQLLKTETDAELTRDLQTLTEQRDAAQKQVERYADEIALIEAELARRQLAAYWLAHPELTAVAVGDRLLITDDFKSNRENYGGVYAWLHTDIEVSELFIDDGMIKCSLKGRIGDRVVVGVGSIPLGIVSGMRRAYLESEAKSTVTFPADSAPWGTFVIQPEITITITEKPESEADDDAR